MKSETKNIRSGLVTNNLTSKPADQEPYFTNEFLYRNIQDIHNLALKYYSAMAAGYLSLKIGDITMQILQKIVSNDLAEIEQKFYADIEKNIERLGIKNELVRQNMRSGTDLPLLQFKQLVETNRGHISRVMQSQPGTPLDVANYSLKDNVLSLTDEDKQRIKLRYCTVFVDSPAKQNFVNIAENIVKELEELKVILIRNGIKQTFGYNQVFEIQESAIEQRLYFNKGILKEINN